MGRLTGKSHRIPSAAVIVAMAKKYSQIDLAYRRVAVLKAIVREERKRAEAHPDKQRNIDLGLSMPDLPIKEAKQEIAQIFNEIEDLLEHLHILHMAASFEFEALPRLGQIIGETRKSIVAARASHEPWPEKLVRATSTFAGLHDIEQTLSLKQDAKQDFDKIRNARNKFSHGVKLSERPDIDADTARLTLYGMLQLIC